MGKLAKQRRFQRWKDAKRIAELNAERDHWKTVAAFNGMGMESEQRARMQAQAQLERIVRAIRAIHSASACLPVSEKIPHYGGRARVALPQRHLPRALWENADFKGSAIEVEELTQFLMGDAQLTHDFARALHFRVVGPNNTFGVGYAVTSRVLQAYRDPDWLVRMICEEFGAHIHRQLFNAEPSQ